MSRGAARPTRCWPLAMVVVGLCAVMASGQEAPRVGARRGGRVLAPAAAARHAARYEAADASLLPNMTGDPQAAGIAPTPAHVPDRVDAPDVVPMHAHGADRFDAPVGAAVTVVRGAIGSVESWVTPGGRVFTAYTLRVTAGGQRLLAGTDIAVTRPGGRVEVDGRVGTVIVPGFGVLPDSGSIEVAVIAGPGDGAYHEVRMPGGAR
jgi:hypothetical protein